MPILYHPDHPPARSVSGVELAQGLGVQEAKGFWADAWSRVLKRPGAVFGLGWLSVIIFFAIFAPFIASGHPFIVRQLDAAGNVTASTSPFLRFLRPTDVLLVVGFFGSLFWLFVPAAANGLSRLLGAIGIAAAAIGALLIALASPIAAHALSSDPEGAAGIATVWSIAGGCAAALAWCLLAAATPRAERGRSLFIAALQCGLIVWGATEFQNFYSVGRPDLSSWMAWIKDHRPLAQFEAPAVIALLATLLAAAPPVLSNRLRQAGAFLAVGVIAAAAFSATWDKPLQTFVYRERQASGEVRCTFAPIPFSPTQANTRLYVLPPGSTIYEPVFRAIEDALADRARKADPRAPRDPAAITVTPADIALVDTALTSFDVGARDAGAIREAAAAVLARPDATGAELVAALRALPFQRFIVGTDPLGQDVLSQLLHACRLSISIGLVSTGISVVIGVTLGALMGYFGGWVDLLLYRVVEIFMAIPVLFLLIVAAAVLPRSTYVMMAIIGCVSWTTAARFTRAEFLRLRGQDFVQSARAVGLPLGSILFKHMLPNGVTPVLVDSSFAIASAILAEAVLSFLGLGPDGQASWGKLLSNATGMTGTFVWWLAIFPGFAIFLTVLSYNLIGEALRDAIDPKLKKARV